MLAFSQNSFVALVDFGCIKILVGIRIISKYSVYFLQYSSINHKLIMDRIIQAHNKNETFAIKINEFSAYAGSAKVKRLASKDRAGMTDMMNAVGGMSLTGQDQNESGGGRDSMKLPPKKIAYNKPAEKDCLQHATNTL